MHTIHNPQLQHRRRTERCCRTPQCIRRRTSQPRATSRWPPKKAAWWRSRRWCRCRRLGFMLFVCATLAYRPRGRWRYVRMRVSATSCLERAVLTSRSLPSLPRSLRALLRPARSSRMPCGLLGRYPASLSLRLWAVCRIDVRAAGGGGAHLFSAVW